MPSVKLKRVSNKGGFSGLRFRINVEKDKDVVVGIFRDAGSYGSGPTVAAVAGWNHDGTERIPARPFLSATLEKHRDMYRKALAAIVKLVITGKVGVDKARRNLGTRGMLDVQKAIRDLKTPPNAAATIARKGFDDPLIWTKKLMNSVGWRIEDK